MYKFELNTQVSLDERQGQKGCVREWGKIKRFNDTNPLSIQEF